MTIQSRHPITGLSGVNDQASALGRQFVSVGPAWDTGVIRDYDLDTQTYSIDCDSGTRDTFAKRITDHPGNTSVLAVGTHVLVCRHLPRGPYIVGTIQGNDLALRMPVANGESGESPGDNVMRAMSGAAVSALESGVASVSVSEGLGVFANGPQDRLDILGGTLLEQTSGSTRGLEYVNGRVNYYARMSSTRDGDDVVYLDIGAKGDIITLRVQPTPAEDVASVKVSLTGAMDVTLRDGCSWYVRGGDYRQVVGDVVHEVTGSLSESVSGEHTLQTGARTVTSDSLIDAVASGRSTTTGGESYSRTGGLSRTQVGGEARYDFSSGVEWVVGDPRAGVPSVGAAQALINYVGDTHIVNVLPGKSFNVVTTGPGTVNLGVPGVATPNPLGGHFVTPAPGVFSVTKYEPLAALLSTLFTLFDTHSHPTPGAPPTTVFVPPVVPVPMSLNATLGGTLAALQSQTVKVGPL